MADPPTEHDAVNEPVTRPDHHGSGGEQPIDADVKKRKRRKLLRLGVVFLFVQGYEYMHAYNDLGLTLNAGIFGTTFFMLTGFHGAHVTLGTFMLIIMFFRALKGHFNKEDCFGFEAAAWYWHFVDVVWIGLFIFVYVLGS